MKKYIPSIVQTGEAQCYICHRKNCALEVHHCIAGRGNRAICTEWGLTVWLCPKCHEQLHDHSVQYRRIQADAQRAFIKAKRKEGYPEDAAKDLWYSRFLKFYDYE